MTPFAPQVRPVTLPDGRSVVITTGQPKSPLPIQGKPNDDDKWWALMLLIGLDDIEQAKATWKRLAPPKFAGLMGGRRFSFDRATQRYVRDAKPIPDTEVRSAYLDVLNKATDEMKQGAARMTTGGIPLDEWQAAQAKRIKDLYIASRGVGVGGLDKLTPEDVQAIKGNADDDNGLANALLRLRRFGGQIARGDSTAASAGTIVNRAGMYASPAHTLYEAGRRAGRGRAVDANGVKIEWEELNVLADSDHCRSTAFTEGCPEVTDAGWSPLGTLPLPGERTCGPACRCSMAYRVKSPAKLSDVTQANFKPGTDEPMQLSAPTFRSVILRDGRTVEVLALSRDGDEDGHWVTIDGEHVHIKNGRIDKGPPALMGKSKSDLSHKITAEHGAKHPVTGTKEGPAKRKEPHEMTKAEHAEYVKNAGSEAIDRHNKGPTKGLGLPPPNPAALNIGQRIAAAEKLGLTPKSPEFIAAATQWSQHKLQVATAMAEGKSVPTHVLAEYTELAKKATADKPVDTTRQLGIFAKDAKGNPVEVGEKPGQTSMFATAKPAPKSEPAQTGVDAKIAKQYDPKATPELPGMTPGVKAAVEGAKAKAPEKTATAKAQKNAMRNAEYAAGKFLRDGLQAQATQASKQMDEIRERLAAKLGIPSTGAMGLTPEPIRMDPEYRQAKHAYEGAADKLHKFNSAFSKKFASEISADFAREREAKLAKSKSLALNADTLASLAQCSNCKSYDVRRIPSAAGGRSLDMCRRCGSVWQHKPGTLTAEQHSGGAMKAACA